jgi:glycosyltransferase involved in cell wall biosynthesis
MSELVEYLDPITVPYLLVTGIPCFVDSAGRRWTDALWHKDLVEHIRYIRDLTLAAPVRFEAPPENSECCSTDERFSNVVYIDLPASDTELSGLINWPRTFWRLFTASRKAKIVHAGVADWPIPTGWSATIASRLHRRLLLIIIESAAWRVKPDATLIKRIRATIWEMVNRWCVRRADIALFTQPAYARELLGTSNRGSVLQASWINHDDVLSEEAVDEIWKKKEKDSPLKLLFAGRLVKDKGVPQLIDAIRNLDVPVHVDFIGAGELSSAIETLSSNNHRVKLLKPVPYGPKFFELLRNYHAIVVPSVTDEQPRVIYDAYSQGVPAIATRTPGLSACVVEGKTGYLAPPGNSAELRSSIVQANAHRSHLRQMGRAARMFASGYTHREMHRRRWRLLNEHLAAVTRL